METNKILWLLGIVLALIGASLMFHGSLLGERTTGIATVIGIVGICLIVDSKRKLKKK